MATPPDIELVHPVPAEEIPAWRRAMATTFLGNPRSSDAERRVAVLKREWEPDRTWGARAAGRWVATLRSTARTLSIPGTGTGTRDITADALTNVTVAATHRRRGLLKQMVTDSLKAARARGDAVSILIAAEWPIYGRYGYAPATLSADYVLRSTRVGATVDGDPSRVRSVEPDEFGEIAVSVFAESRRLRAGQVDRSPSWWDAVLGLNGHDPSPDLPHNWLVHESDSGPDGLLAWRETTGHFGLIPPYGQIDVWNLSSATDSAYQNLWAYLTGIDVTDEIHLATRPVDEPVRWLLHDARTLVMKEQVDFMWLRLLDLQKALEARRYAVDGELVIEVLDAGQPSFTAGRYRLKACGEEVECAPTTATPDLEITQNALASMYLGGFRLRQLGRHVASEHSQGALERLDLMFSTPRPPWNATWF